VILPAKGDLRGIFFAWNRFFRTRNRFFQPPLMTGRIVRHGNKQSNMAENNRLKAARVLVGMTQLQLAEKVGVKEITVSRFETGRSAPNDETKRRIVAVLHKPAFELFDA
jgi:DNA-binding XRE family transcriptional regulator